MRHNSQARSLTAIAVVLLVVGALLSVPVRKATADVPCPNYLLLGSRGSGQAPPGTEGDLNDGLGQEVAQFRNEFQALLPAGRTFGVKANTYKAVAVSGKSQYNKEWWLWNLFTARWAIPSPYHMSVAEGMGWLAAEVDEAINLCASSGTRILLAGYSQGAQVTGNAYQALSAAQRDHVWGVVLIADPRFNGSDGTANAGSYSPRRSGAVRELATPHQKGRPEFPADSNGRVLSYCLARDPVCQGLFSFRNSGMELSTPAQHTNYHLVGDDCSPQTYPQRAAAYFAFRAGNQRVSSGPVARLTSVEDAARGRQVEISAAGSCEQAGRPVTYRWDLDGSGAYATDTGSHPELTTSFGSNGAHQVSVRVTNDQGQTSTATTTVNVSDPGEYTDVPSAPTNVVSTPAPDGTSATLTWDPPASGPPAEAYLIYTSDGFPLEDVQPGAARSVTIPEGFLGLELQVMAVNRVGIGPPSDPVTVHPAWPPGQPGSAASCGPLNTMFNTYGNTGGRWSGADSTGSVKLPDGRTAWLFSDTFLGTVNADYSRPASTPFIHNSIVVQNGTSLTTLTGGTAAAPKSLVGAETDSEPGDLGWWVGDGRVNGSTLQVFYHHYKSGGGGALDYVPQGTGIATFSLPSLTLQRLVPLGNNPQIDWGAALVNGNDGFTYIYGVEAADGAKHLRIARAPSGSLLGPVDAPTQEWTYWTGNPDGENSGWATDENDGARVMTGVGNGFSVKYLNGRYVLVTIDSDRTFSRSVFAYFADKPTGPFGRQTWLYDAPEATGSRIAYDARLHPEQSCNGSNIVISYNVNSLDNAENYADARIYRPRFIVATLPAAPDVSSLPGPPTDLAATVDTDARVSLSWKAPTGPNNTNLTYQVYQRAASAGHTQYTPVPGTATTATSATVGIVDGGVYNYRVTARNTAGEGSPSQMVSVEVDVPPPAAAPSNVRARTIPNGDIGLSWTSVPGAGWVNYRVYQKDQATPDADYEPAITGGSTATGATVTGLTPGHTYQFTVSAYNSGGEGPRSAPVTATSTVVSPTNVTAQPLSDGQIKVSWTAPGPDLWYWVYYHDDTADPDNEKPFTQTAYPVVGGTSVTLGYLTGGNTYSFYVTTVSSRGESAPSNRATATSALPIAPRLTATARNDGGIDLAWTAPAPGYMYWVYYHDDTADPSGAAGFTRYELPFTKTTFTATPLYIGHKYTYYVTSASGGATSVPSNRASATAYLPSPTGLSASAGDGKIQLWWQEPLPGQWYWVYMKVGNGSYTRMTYPVTSGTSMTASPLTNGQQYSFYVTTIGSGGGESQPSNAVSATPRATPPNAPTGVTAASNADASITVSWHRANANDWYWVYSHDDTADPSGSVPFAHGPYPVTTGSSLRMEGLQAGHRYSFYVTTISSVNGTESGPSDVARAWSRLAPPTGLQRSANADGSVSLWWNASVGNVSYYWVYMKAPGSNSFTRMAYPVHNQTGFVARGLRAGQTYQFYVTAAGSYGNESDGSNVVTVVPTLSPPSNLTASVSGWGTVTLRWTRPFAGAYYWVYYHDDTADPGRTQPYSRLKYPLTDASTDGFPMGEGLTGDHTYSFFVTTAFDGNESGWSNVVAPNRRIAAPTGLRGWTVARGPTLDRCGALTGPTCHIHLQWNAVEGAHHYDVFRRLDSADDVAYQYVGSSNSNSYDMPVGTLAQYRVSYEVVAVRWYGTSHSVPSSPVRLTMGDYGGDGTDCYAIAGAPYIIGSTVRFTSIGTCPRSKKFKIIWSMPVVDNSILPAAPPNYCHGTTSVCSVQASTQLRGGSHNYCTAVQLHAVDVVGSNGGAGMVISLISRCVRYTG
ncbi:fibronectin type III domain-containing protein [Micromonospora sp. CPCC 205371]|nr:fibronectin type III domain-containing protein [Micromonospora sp. CPCC 205371]